MSGTVFILLSLLASVTSGDDEVKYEVEGEQDYTFAGDFVHQVSPNEALLKLKIGCIYQVSGFHDSEDVAKEIKEKEAKLREEQNARKGAEIISKGWKRHPLFIIIIGG